MEVSDSNSSTVGYSNNNSKFCGSNNHNINTTNNNNNRTRKSAFIEGRYCGVLHRQRYVRDAQAVICRSELNQSSRKKPSATNPARKAARDNKQGRQGDAGTVAAD